MSELDGLKRSGSFDARSDLLIVFDAAADLVDFDAVVGFEEGEAAFEAAISRFV
jgi:hypothetical protein